MNYDILPFLLKLLPKLRSLGFMGVVHGLRAMKDLSTIDDDIVTGLEEVFITKSNYRRLEHYSWATTEGIRMRVSQFLKSQTFSGQSPEDQRNRFLENLQLLIARC